MPDQKNGNRLSLRPVAALTAVCLAVSGLLAAANAVSAPIIERMQAQRIRETLVQLMPQATSFTELPCDMDGVDAVYRDDGGSGYAVVTRAKGYNGDVLVTTALDQGGVVSAISVDASGESPSKSQAVEARAFTDAFIGLGGPSGGADISSGATRSSENVDLIGGATYSSKAVRDAVSLALAAYRKITEEGDLAP
jgi:Na+-translocating ferredoxin:NAD+ oxidoreductase RnfG subunit